MFFRRLFDNRAGFTPAALATVFFLRGPLFFTWCAFGILGRGFRGLFLATWSPALGAPGALGG